MKLQQNKMTTQRDIIQEIHKKWGNNNMAKAKQTKTVKIKRRRVRRTRRK